ncbi:MULTISPECIES: Atu4866 domain-containing protein [unclassified Streptomyces]|uniref:Atu4866 domain-containing protein n=1 Tax=unclassified Streptomyces TaxID=2593676 RepID=UPI000BC5F832|nr:MULTISPECIES: Atu4866 domain-containing protein [unclassified Streptomyces]MDN3250115.1 Atu4866 domain-containing protein [Streptomyces sp. ZSW22]MDN3257687.1 Atu4866 domain-containing protein [Streptomyces sp. MA25(2023)]PAK26260.1 amidohydrolase [Streptomyces sp. alain-838]
MTTNDTHTRTGALSWHPEALDEILSNDGSRPVLFTNARIVTMDPLIGTMTGADILFVGSLIVGVGPAIVTAAQDDNAIVVDCTGTTIVPAVVDTVALTGGRGQRSKYVATLTPGNSADFLVVPDELAADVPSAVATLMSRPDQVRALVAAGRPVRWSGTEITGEPAATRTGMPAASDLTGSPRVGVWIDREDFLHQELTADGRYDETRGGRPHAYQGRFWIDGDRIDYLDDLGFWAYGEFKGDELHHAGYVMKLN